MEMIIFDIESYQLQAMYDIVWFGMYLFLTVWVWKPEWIKLIKFLFRKK